MKVLAVQKGGKGAVLLFLAGDLPGEDVAVDVRGDGDEGQALEFGRIRRLHLTVCHRSVTSAG
ncbi:hypothetical protein [Streptomyces misionensis]|uniref:hypothetical protein n=1 Tax=Streptomyces misionensis TaxID=67331 RepID=UPI00367D5614